MVAFPPAHGQEAHFIHSFQMTLRGPSPETCLQLTRVSLWGGDGGLAKLAQSSVFLFRILCAHHVRMTVFATISIRGLFQSLL